MYLDGNEVTWEPTNTTQLKERIYFAKELYGYLKEVQGSITFTGSEYNYLRSVFEQNVCGDVSVLIQLDNREIRGRILISDIKWIPPKRQCECEIVDDSYISRIDNNKKIKALLDIGKSKNGLDIVPVVQTDCEFPNPTDTSSATNRSGVRVFDAFTFLLSFMSDGEIGFKSDFFDPTISTGNEPYLTLFRGVEIRSGLGYFPYLSYYELLTDIISLYNLQWGMEVDSSGIYLRLEPSDYFKQQTSTVTFDNVNEFEQSIDTSTFYARVKFGSAQSDDENYTYLQDIRFQSFNEEEYHLAGQCNIDNELNLVCETLITDTNIIQDIMPIAQGGTNNTGYDEDVFIVQLDSNNKVMLTPKPATPTEFYFNENLTNRAVALRWFGQIPQSIYAYLGDGGDWASALLSANQILPVGGVYGTAACNYTGSFPYGDPNGNYTVGVVSNGYNSTLAGYYTAPSNAVYNITFSGHYTGLVSQVYIHRMNGSTIVSSQQIYYPQEYVDSLNYYLIEGGATFYMNAGERALVVFVLAQGTIHEGATFEVADPLGARWATYDSNSVYLLQQQFKYPISDQDWESIINSPYGIMRMTYNDGQIDNWLVDIERDILTGDAELKMSGKNG
jgi:hypothetical protein